MTDLPPQDSSRTPTWRARYDAARARGVPLDPKGEPVEGVTAYPTSYASDHLLVTVVDQDLETLLKRLGQAAGDFGWGVRLENLDGTALDPARASERARR